MTANGGLIGYNGSCDADLRELEATVTSEMKAPEAIKRANQKGALYFNTRSVNNDAEQYTEIYRDDQDALIYAHQKDIKIDAKDEIAWAIDNDRDLAVGQGKTMRAIDYAKEIAPHSIEMRRAISEAIPEKREGYVAPKGSMDKRVLQTFSLDGRPDPVRATKRGAPAASRVKTKDRQVEETRAAADARVTEREATVAAIKKPGFLASCLPFLKRKPASPRSGRGK